MDKSTSLNQAFNELFESKKSADVTFLVHGKELQTLKIILSTRSPVFEAMFNSNLTTKDGKYLIEDPEITFEDFNNFMKFLYCDKCVFNYDNIEKMLHLSNFYGVKYFADACLKYIKQSVTADTLLKYAEIGLKLSETCSLLDICFYELPNYISYIPFKYQINGEYKLISKELALKIAEDCPREGSITEDVMFKKLFEWATIYYDTPKCYKTAMSPFLPYIQFENLKLLTLATTVNDHKLLSIKKYSEIITKAVILKENPHLLPKRSNTISFGTIVPLPEESPPRLRSRNDDFVKIGK